MPAARLDGDSCRQVTLSLMPANTAVSATKAPPSPRGGLRSVLHGLGMLGISAFGGTFGQEGFRFSLSRDEWFSATRTWIPLTSEQNLLVPPLVLTNRVR